MKYVDLNKEEYCEFMKNPPDNARFRVYIINEGKAVKIMKAKKSKYTLNQLGDKVDKLDVAINKLGTTVDKLATKVDQIANVLFEFIKTTNERFDNLTSDVNSLKQGVKAINARLDYNNLRPLPKIN